MPNKNLRQGFSTILIVFVVLLLVLGIAGYFLLPKIQSNQQNSNPEEADMSLNQNSPTGMNEIEIKEVGLKITVPDQIKDLVYQYKEFNDGWVLHFSTKSLIAASAAAKENSCVDGGPLGAISEYSYTPENQLPDPKTLGDNFKQLDRLPLHYTTPPDSCSNNEQVADLQIEQTELLQKAFKTIERAN